MPTNSIPESENETTRSFEIISQFLQSFETEVSGHEAVVVSPELQTSLDRMARGECTPTEREKLCQLMRDNPDYVPVLAQSIKALRPAGAR